MREWRHVRVWREQNWIWRIRGRKTKPICHRYSLEAAFVVAGWLSQDNSERYVVEDTETGNVLTVQSGDIL